MKRVLKKILLTLLIGVLLMSIGTGRSLAEDTDIAGGDYWRITADGELMIGTGTPVEIPAFHSSGDVPWYSYRSKITSATVQPNVSATSTDYWFNFCQEIKRINLSNLDTSNVKSMNHMFFRCDYLTSLDLSNFDTGNVTDMGYMFGYCSSLTSLDLSRFDTSKVTDMSYMFGGCISLSSLDLSVFDTGSVTNMEGMFNDCSALKSLDLSSFDTANVMKMGNMFLRCSSLPSLDLRHFNTGNVVHMQGMFGACTGLTALDVSSFDTSKVTSMNGMFAGCSSLTSLDLSRFDTAKVIDMSQMFYKCSSLPTVDLSHFDTGKVTKMSQMFSECSALKTMDLSGLNISNVTTLDRLFEKCPKLTSVNLSGLDTGNVTSIRDMFVGCSGLTSLDLSSFDTSKVIDMYRMFSGCSKLQILDLSSFDTSKVSLMTDMFKCENLREIRLGNKFTKWTHEAYLPEGTWVNGSLEKTEKELYNEYPGNAETYAGTWVRNGVDPGPDPVEPEVTRVSGSDRYATSLEAANQLKELMGVDKFDAVVVTTGKSFADALAGSYLANHNNAPILLVNQKNASKVTEYINKNLKDNGKVYILGGASAVEDGWFSGLNTANVERVAGKDRYKTDLEILKKAGYTGGNLLVCVGKSVNASGADTAFADSLSVSAVDIPILLVDKKGLKADQIEFLKSLSTTPNFYVIGGTGAVPDEIVQSLLPYGNFVKRVSGKNRYATSAEIAKEFFSSPEKAVLSYGENFPDGLSGGALAYHLHAPLLLTNSGTDKGKDSSGKRQWAIDYCKSSSITSGIVMGGTSLIDEESAALIFSSVTSR